MLKVAAKDRGLTYREAVDEALCFDWIDGVRSTSGGPSSSKPRVGERAWSFFRAQAPWYQRTSIFWVMEQNVRRPVRGCVRLLRAVARLL